MGRAPGRSRVLPARGRSILGEEGERSLLGRVSLVRGSSKTPAVRIDIDSPRLKAEGSKFQLCEGSALT